MMDNVEEGKGLLENVRAGPDLWRDRTPGSSYRMRNYSTSKDSLNLNSDTLLKEKNRSDFSIDVSERYFVFSDVCTC